MKKLQLSKNLSLPVDAITQTFLVVGKRGSGKSNTAARLVEQFHRAKLPFVVLDPVDTWWGLKASADGSGPGLDVYVFGGRKQNLPLEPGGGALIAEVLCDHRISMVLSVKHLSGKERSSFMVAFAQTLFQKWQGGPLHVVLEEAHELAPQMAGGRGGNNQDNEAAMLGAFKRLWKLGRASGIGGTAVTQRPASLSKDITTQSEILIAHRTIGPQDVKAIGEWVKYHGQHEQILGELPTLPTGEAFVWAPEFPADKPLGLVRTSVYLRETYDSASTPKVGEQRVEPKQLADVDLERLRTKMAATIERAKADDPKELKKQIVELRKQLGSKVDPSPAPKIVEKAALTDADRKLIEKLADGLRLRLEDAGSQMRTLQARLQVAVTDAAHDYFNDNLDVARKATADVEAVLEKPSVKKLLEKLQGLAVPRTVIPAPARQVIPQTPKPQVPSPRLQPRTPSAGESNGVLTDGQQKILDTVLILEARGVRSSLDGICAWMDIHPNGGRFRGNLRELREQGYLDDTSLTEKGRLVARAKATGLEEAKRVLTDGQRTIIETLEANPEAMSIERLAELMGIHANGGRFRGNVRRLREMGIITSGGQIKLTEAAFS